MGHSTEETHIPSTDHDRRLPPAQTRLRPWSPKSLFLTLACVLGIAGLGGLPPQAFAYPPQVDSIAEGPVTLADGPPN
jgi:hypothetical protein